jgi:hypothetical protein
MVQGLMARAGEKIPTSSVGRIGRTAFAALRSGRMIWRGQRRAGEDDQVELDMEQITKLVSSVGRLKGVAMKMGQIMSYIDVAIPQEMREVFKKKMQLMKFTLPGEFMFLFRIRFGLMSVLSRLGARANWYRLEKSYVEDFARAHPILSD